MEPIVEHQLANILLKISMEKISRGKILIGTNLNGKNLNRENQYENLKDVLRLWYAPIGCMSCEQLCFSCFELFCCGTMVKNGITDACSTADCCPLLTIFPRCCPRHATDDVPDMPQMMPRMMPQMMLQTCPR